LMEVLERAATSEDEDDREQAAQEAQELIGQADPIKLRRSLSRAITQVEEQVKAVEATVAGWGSDPGQVERFMFNPELSNSIQGGKLKRILELAGKMRKVVSAQRSKRPLPAPDQIQVEPGSDPTKALASELAWLADPETEDGFFVKVVTGSLLIHDRVERERPGKGPFIVCVDESGSMAGSPEEWAKALGFALATQARVEGRKFGAVCFGSSAEVRFTWNPGLEDLVEFFSQFYAGGTCFETPLREAMGLISREAPEADILFITDGEADVSDGFLDWFKSESEASDVKVVGIQVGFSPLDLLRKFCHSTFRLSTDLSGLEAVIDELK